GSQFAKLRFVVLPGKRDTQLFEAFGIGRIGSMMSNASPVITKMTAIKLDEQISSIFGQLLTERNRAEHVTVLGIFRQIRSNADPKIVQTTTSPIFWLHKTTTHLNAVLELGRKTFVEI